MGLASIRAVLGAILFAPVLRPPISTTPHDWPPAALVLDAGILMTGDHDLLGCGCPIWTAEKRRDEVGRS